MDDEATADPHTVGELVHDLDDLADTKSDISIGDLLDRYGDRSFGIMLLIPPLLEISPIGAIPGIPTFLAVMIALVALQLLAGRDHIWFPDFIEKRSVTSQKLHSAADKLEGLAQKIDAVLGNRLEWLTDDMPQRIAAAIIVALCCMVPPLEFLPFASTVPMAVVAVFGLALVARDGMLMLLAFLLSGGAGIAAAYMMLSGATGS